MKEETKARWLAGLGLGGTLLLILASPLILMFSALGPSCGNDQVEEVLSPNGRWKAVIFRRDCGATTDYSRQVSLLRGDKPLRNEGGNILVVGDDAPLRARWADDGHLILWPAPPGKIFLRETEKEGIRISYE